MTRIRSFLGIVILALSVQFCGRSGTNGTPSPPPDLPSYTAEEHDTSYKKTEAAEKQLNEAGWKFATRRLGNGAVVLAWDMPSLRNILAEHRDPPILDDQLEKLEAYSKVLSEHVGRFGKGYYRLEGGRKIYVPESDDLIHTSRVKFEIVQDTIAKIHRMRIENVDEAGGGPSPVAGGGLIP